MKKPIISLSLFIAVLFIPLSVIAQNKVKLSSEQSSDQIGLKFRSPQDWHIFIENDGVVGIWLDIPQTPKPLFSISIVNVFNKGNFKSSNAETSNPSDTIVDKTISKVDKVIGKLDGILGRKNREQNSTNKNKNEENLTLLEEMLPSFAHSVTQDDFNSVVATKRPIKIGNKKGFLLRLINVRYQKSEQKISGLLVAIPIDDSRVLIMLGMASPPELWKYDSEFNAVLESFKFFQPKSL